MYDAIWQPRILFDFLTYLSFFNRNALLGLNRRSDASDVLAVRKQTLSYLITLSLSFPCLFAYCQTIVLKSRTMETKISQNLSNLTLNVSFDYKIIYFGNLDETTFLKAEK